MTTPDQQMRPWSPIIGRWRSSGTVFDEAGTAVQAINGTDEYEWMVGGHWVIHRVDVMMGSDRVQALELIGDHDGGDDSYTMRAFDSSGEFSAMTARRQADGSWIFTGDAMRVTLWVADDGSSMTNIWQRRHERSGDWIRWMEMQFERLD